MTALSDLIRDAKVAPARAIERIEKSDEHKMNKGTVYRYLSGNHPASPKEEYLLALAYGFDLSITEVRMAVLAAPGELGPWSPPLESGRLSQAVRDALDALIITLAKEGTGSGKPAQEIDGVEVVSSTEVEGPKSKQRRDRQTGS